MEVETCGKYVCMGWCSTVVLLVVALASQLYTHADLPSAHGARAALMDPR